MDLDPAGWMGADLCVWPVETKHPTLRAATMPPSRPGAPPGPPPDSAIMDAARAFADHFESQTPETPLRGYTDRAAYLRHAAHMWALRCL